MGTFGDGSSQVDPSPVTQHTYTISPDDPDVQVNGEKEFIASLVVRNLLTNPPDDSVNASQQSVVVTINTKPTACIDPAGPFAGNTAETPDGFVLEVDASIDVNCSSDPDPKRKMTKGRTSR